MKHGGSDVGNALAVAENRSLAAGDQVVPALVAAAGARAYLMGAPEAYLQASGILDAKKSPFSRWARGRTGVLTESPMSRIDAWRMIRRARRTRSLMRIFVATRSARLALPPFSTTAAPWRRLN